MISFVLLKIVVFSFGGIPEATQDEFDGESSPG
jgi:hypothetical protein